MIIVGNSHVAALRDGLLLLDEDEAGRFTVVGSRGRFEQSVFFETQPNGLAFTDPELARRIARFSGDTMLSPSTEWGFCFGHAGFLFNDHAWKSYQTIRADARSDAGKQVVSAGVLRVFIEAAHANVIAFFEAASRAGVNFTMILGPPPRRNAHAIMNLGVSQEQIRAIYRTAAMIFAGKAAALGVPVVDAPPETVDDDGFLKEEFCAADRPDGRPDRHHANAEYGKLMLRRIAARA